MPDYRIMMIVLDECLKADPSFLAKVQLDERSPAKAEDVSSTFTSETSRSRSMDRTLVYETNNLGSTPNGET